MKNQTDVFRHCEPAKQSRCTGQILDCFVPRNDVKQNSSLVACEAIQKPDVHLDCFVPRNDVKQTSSLRACEAIQVQSDEIQGIWIASCFAMTEY